MSAVPRFRPGDLVTVRRGTRDPDFPDIPLGGWTGTIRELGEQHPEPHYLVLWNEFTRTNMHPVYRHRCVRDSLDIESMWLRESDLEPTPSQQPSLEQPEQLKPRPLRLDNPTDRIRAALGLTSDDPLPEVNAQSLRSYHAYLTQRLRFPLAAEFIEEEADFAAPPLPVQILRLWPIEELDPNQGLQAEVREGRQVFLVPLDTLQVPGDPRAAVLLQDYASWFLDWADQQDDLDTSSAEFTPQSLFTTAARWIAFGGGCGACVGAVLASMELARYGLVIGAFVLGAVGYLAGSRFGGVLDLSTGRIRSTWAGTLIPVVAGTILGGVLGTLAVAAMGSFLGAMAFSLLGSALESLRLRLLGGLGWACLGGLVGALTYALYLNQEAALNGALLGAAVGGGGVLLLLILTVIVFAVIHPEDEPPG